MLGKIDMSKGQSNTKKCGGCDVNNGHYQAIVVKNQDGVVVVGGEWIQVTPPPPFSVIHIIRVNRNKRILFVVTFCRGICTYSPLPLNWIATGWRVTLTVCRDAGKLSMDSGRRKDKYVLNDWVFPRRRALCTNVEESCCYRAGRA